MDEVLKASPMADWPKEPLAQIVATQGPRLRAFVRREIRDWVEADDIVQDAFEELASVYGLTKPIEHVAAWLTRVVRHRIIDRYRAKAREATLFEPARSRRPMPEAEPERVVDTWMAPIREGPEGVYFREQVIDELAAALEELPAEQREVFVAHEFDGKSFKELAAETGTGLSTLLGRKHAAVKYLRRRLADLQLILDQSSES
jgi:RNA polymerase sigma factor (sigma-70 family)